MKNKILGLVLIILFSCTSISFAEDKSSDEEYEDTKNNIDLYIDNQLSKINIDEIDENTISNHLSTKDIPDPDLMIRTSGEERLSNFLLWEVAYAEFYFTNVHWPDFDEKELQKAIFTYQNRDRRFGGIK